MAALLSDTTVLTDHIAAAGRVDDADLQFLADWAGFWAFGAEWPSPIAARPPTLKRWQDDQAWMLGRRRHAAAEQRAGRGLVRFISGSPLPCARIELNDVSGVVILDTGAPSSVITPEFSERAGLARRPGSRMAYDGAGNGTEISSVVAAAVRIDDWDGANLPFETMPLSAALGVDGIVSPFDLFGRVSLTFDHDRRRLDIGELPPADAVVQRLFWSEGSASIRVDIAGETMFALIDSGAGATVVTDEAASRMGSGGEPFRSVTAMGSVIVSALGSATIMLPNMPALLQPLYVKATAPQRLRPLPRLADAYLGWPWFMSHKVHFPAQRGSLLLQPN
ncbi:aspartyl protease family protein [Bradyrhizobium sp. HKCCYLS20291]|uniref:aspartyl protease family protein n=1 Tax=Bradyrhizobium sp. HKCCYLS20291 TaxID=3420766 RepID=UPI003EBE9FD8